VPVDTSVISVMAVYSDLLCKNWSEYAARIDNHSGTIPVILVRHRLWLPDDGSCVSRNMLEQLLRFKCVFNKPTVCIIECISWTIKYLILLMHGAIMNISKF